LTSGGGVWGDSLDRDPAMVQWDMIEELVTAENARNDYGVVLAGPDHELDEAATKALRETMRTERGDPDPPTIKMTAALAAE